MMDQIASLMQRGLISPDAAQNLMQQVNYWQNKGIQPPLMEQGGAGTRMGATTTREPLLGYSNPKQSANTNKSPRDQFIDEYDALVRQKAADINRSEFKVMSGSKKSSTSQPSVNKSSRLPDGYEIHQGEDPVTGENGWHVVNPSGWMEHSAATREDAISEWLKGARHKE